MNKIKGPKLFETVYRSLWVGALVYYSEGRVHSFHQEGKERSQKDKRHSNTTFFQFHNYKSMLICSGLKKKVKSKLVNKKKQLDYIGLFKSKYLETKTCFLRTIDSGRFL